MILTAIKTEEICKFTGFQNWVNKASTLIGDYKQNSIICLDTKNRVCSIGRDFQRAERENTFPITVYAARKVTVENWQTYKKRMNPTITTVRDSDNSFVRETVVPTLSTRGWKNIFICEVGLVKPKQTAEKIIKALLTKDYVDDSHFIYSFTKGKNGYEDCLHVFYREKNIKS